MVGFIKLYLYVPLRYGNPDRQILATLKLKIGIYMLLDVFMQDLGFILIFRVTIYFLNLKLC